MVASGNKSCKRDSEWSVCDKRETGVEVELLVTKDSWKHSCPLHALPAAVSAWRHFVTGPNCSSSPSRLPLILITQVVILHWSGGLSMRDSPQDHSNGTKRSPTSIRSRIRLCTENFACNIFGEQKFWTGSLAVAARPHSILRPPWSQSKGQVQCSYA